MLPVMIAAVAGQPDWLVVFGLDTSFGVLQTSFSEGQWDPGWGTVGGVFVSSLAATRWGSEGLAVVGIGLDGSVFYELSDGEFWEPAWQTLSGKFVSPPKLVSWGGERLDAFGMGLDGGCYHKSFDGTSWGQVWEWGNLGGTFLSPPSVVAWGPNRLDIIGLGLDGAYYHRAWNGTSWDPLPWRNLGGTFRGPPSIVSWGPNRLDVFGMGTNGSFYHRAWTGSSWQPEWEPLGGTFQSDPAAVAWGPNRLDVFGTGLDGAIWHRAWDGNWLADWGSLGGSFVSAPTAVSWGPNRLDVFAVGTDQAVHHRSADGSGWSSKWDNLGGTFALNAPAPSDGLGSNSNYLLAGGGANLRGLTVRIRATQDIVCPSGFSFQLNCHSPQNFVTAFQQYVIGQYPGNQIGAAFEDWTAQAQSIAVQTTAISSLSKVPAGYTLEIALQSDASDSVVSATYTVFDENGNVNSGLEIATPNTAPVVAFELNLVGLYNGESAVLSSGAGTIEYTCSTPLTPLPAVPGFAEGKFGTAEKANSFYSFLGGAAAKVHIQRFQVNQIDAETLMIQKHGKLVPRTRRRLT